jgi:hypothetical protein
MLISHTFFRVTNFLSALGKKSQIVEHSDWLKKLDEDLQEIKEKNANLVDGGDRLLVAGAYELLTRHSLNDMKSGLWAILGIEADNPNMEVRVKKKRLMKTGRERGQLIQRI